MLRRVTEHVEANGVRFAYLTEGEGPLVLLLHGFPDTARSWDRTRAVLAEAGFRAVSPWMRGYVPTEIPGNAAYDAQTLGRDVVELVRALGEEQAIVVGHDWGALASYAAVGLAPEVVRKLVTIAIPHPASMRPTPSLLWRVRHFVTLRLPGAARRIRAGDFAHIDELVRRWSPQWDPSPEETADVKRSFAEAGCLEAAIGYYRALTPTVPACLRRKVDVPSVAFAGLHDMIDPSLYDRAASRYRGDYTVVRMPGGHFMHREHPDDFHRELLRVLH
jgi:pimeloyl-ACP methyl ester carboxylesterase